MLLVARNQRSGAVIIYPVSTWPQVTIVYLLYVDRFPRTENQQPPLNTYYMQGVCSNHKAPTVC